MENIETVKRIAEELEELASSKINSREEAEEIIKKLEGMENFTDEEIKELEAAAEAERLELAERIAAAEKRLEAEEAAERKEVEQAEKELRISKKGNEILTIFITPKEERLYRKLNAGKYISVKALTEHIESIRAIKELKIKEL